MKSGDSDQFNEDKANRIAYLVAGFLRQTLSGKEHDELDKWIEASDENQVLFEELIDPAMIEKGLAEYDRPDTGAALEKIKTKLKFAPVKTNNRKKRIIQYSIAASILLLAGTITIVLVKGKKNKSGFVKIEKPDILPGGNKATLTLVNGKTINLENAKNGLLDSAGGTDVLKTAEGQLSYENSKQQETKGEHILATPAGGQYNVTLPDGSRVWLNASSSLKYPVTFDKNERVVELTGEGYFEVAKEKSADITGMELGRKFIVKLKNEARIEVLGTHFNIMAYDDEKYIQTTLLSGVVNVKTISMGAMLSPGYQSSIIEHGYIDTKKDVDTSLVVAWKNGKFQFKDAPIETVMRQVARWYNAEIVYEGKTDYHFNATAIYRTEPLSKLLGVLEATNRVHFTIEGKKIIVKP